MPRTPRRLAALLLAGATLASLAACAPADPEPTSSPPVESTTDDPIFASDEEALAAAIAAYEAYLLVSQEIAQEGNDVERIRSVTTGEYADTRVDQLNAFIESGLRLRGAYEVDTTSLVERSPDGAGELVVIYACEDVSDTTIVNDSGVDVTPTNREARVPLVVEVLLQGDDAAVAGSDVWSGENFC